MESRKVVNTVLFNHSTDVFLCDTTCNFNTTMKYLRENINIISFTHTNHNVKFATTNLWEALVQL